MKLANAIVIAIAATKSKKGSMAFQKWARDKKLFIKHQEKEKTIFERLRTEEVKTVFQRIRDLKNGV